MSERIALFGGSAVRQKGCIHAPLVFFHDLLEVELTVEVYASKDYGHIDREGNDHRLLDEDQEEEV